MFKRLRRAGLVPLAVLPHAHKPVDQRQQRRDDRGDDDGEEARGVAGRVGGFEEEGPNEVACLRLDTFAKGMS
jgi:hypothetical protein